MLQTFLSTLRASASNDLTEPATRRRSPRRESDRCVIVICGQSFPVENWSQGGVLIAGDSRLFGVGHEVDVTLKFKLRNTILDIQHSGRVVRKSAYRVALEFKPLGRAIRRAFQQVIDDALAREFANSQVT